VSNYPDLAERLEKLENLVSELQREMKQLNRCFEKLEEEVQPAIVEQRIRDNMRGM